MESRQRRRCGEPTVAEPRDGLVPMQRENGMDSYPAPLGFQRRAKEHLWGRAVGVHLIPPDLQVPEGHSSVWRDQVSLTKWHQLGSLEARPRQFPASVLCIPK